MRKHLWYVAQTTLMLLLSILGSCSDNNGYPDVDGQSPSVALTTEHIQTEAGRTITVEGTVADKDGLATISLECVDLNLKKTIDLLDIYKEALTTYELRYDFPIGRDEIGDQFTIKVTVTDVGGRVASQELLVTMDGDFAPPTFTTAPDKAITVLMKANTKFNLRFALSDNRALDYVTIDIPGVEGYAPRRVDLSGQKTYDFSESVVLPNEAREYTVTLTAVDRSGKETVATSTLSVSEMPDFEKMYLADVTTAAALNSDVFGVPMRVERTAPYQYRARYYNQAAGTPIFFLPQKSDFNPICFGLDPEDSSKLTDDPDLAKPIQLTEANVYYDITFNILQSTYAISTYPISEAGNRLPQPIGSDFYLDKSQPEYIIPFQIGVLGNLPGCNGSPSGLLIFTQDAVNPNLFYTDNVALEAGTQLNFIIHNKHDWGWWDYCLWRVDNADDPEIFLYGGQDINPKPQDIWGKPTVRTTGTYKFWFDAHLERGKLVRVN